MCVRSPKYLKHWVVWGILGKIYHATPIATPLQSKKQGYDVSQISKLETLEEIYTNADEIMW